MKIRNENLQIIDSENYALDVLNELQSNPLLNISEVEAQKALADLYYQTSLMANQSIFKNQYYAMPIAKVELNRGVSINNLWKIVKRHFCAIATPASTQEEIVTIIIAAIALIMPLGIIIMPLLVIIITYFLKKGIENIC
ncbi:hypothetical protein [Pedobacter alpinus]|uniref:Uncharacterized protein n=1 Tax=Pedobacter alpinus TaxID=1590643 RepID=A0ABW5TRE4_9SPHI